ncbi:MAG TPA: hypothetical protein VLI90_19395, partial [Tepidisphaeraceae bacterium]|nr:hypothetical protein [Tepidisphaeraceae bacterium]
ENHPARRPHRRRWGGDRRHRYRRRRIQRREGGDDDATEITRWRDYLTEQVKNYNQRVAGGKWNHVMPGLVTGKVISAWSSQVRWPWGEKGPATTTTSAPASEPVIEATPVRPWRGAAACDRQTNTAAGARWVAVAGLGPSGRAMSLQPATLETSFQDGHGPCLQFDFQSDRAGDAEALLDFLPTFRLVPGMQLRVAVSVDDGPPRMLEIPGSSGKEDERGPVRTLAVQANYVRARVPLSALSAGKHTFKIYAVDPGAVLDRVSLP